MEFHNTLVNFMKLLYLALAYILWIKFA